MLDGQFRYAQKIGERVAFKISGGAMRANDFVATNFDATAPFIEPANNAAGSNLGYDAVSRYGDIGNTFPASATAQGYAGPFLANKTVFLPGYTERQLVAGPRACYVLLAFRASMMQAKTTKCSCCKVVLSRS